MVRQPLHLHVAGASVAFPPTHARIHMRWVWVGSADLVGHLGGGGGQEFLVARVHGAREHKLCTPGALETSTSQ